MAKTERRRRQAAAPREAAPAGGRRTRENLPRPAGGAATPGPAAIARPTAQPRPRRLGFLRRAVPRGVADIVSELRKVTWPTVAETRYLTIVVAIVAVAVGIFLGALDLLFGYTIEQLFF